MRRSIAPVLLTLTVVAPAWGGGPYPDLILELLPPEGEESSSLDVASCGESNFVAGRLLEGARFRAVIWTLDALPFPVARRVPEATRLPYTDDDDEKSSDQTATVLYCSTAVPEGSFPCVAGTIAEDAVVWDYDSEGESWSTTDIGTLGGTSATPNGMVKTPGGDTVIVGEAADEEGISRPVIWVKRTGLPWTIDIIDTPGSVAGAALDVLLAPGGDLVVAGWVVVSGDRRAVVWIGAPGDWTFEPLPERPGNVDGSLATTLLLTDGVDLRVGGHEDTPPPFPPADTVFGYSWKYGGPGSWTLTLLDPSTVGNVLRVRDLVVYESDCARAVVGTALPATAALVDRVPILWGRDCVGGPLDPADINDLVVSGPADITMRTGVTADAGDYLFIAGDGTRTGQPTVPLAVVVRSSTPLAVHPTGLGGPAALLVPGSNPYRAGDAIAFQLPHGGQATLDLHDVAGRHLRRLVDADLGPGTHGTTWDGRDGQGRPVRSGVVFLRLRYEGGERTTRLVLTR